MSLEHQCVSRPGLWVEAPGQVSPGSYGREPQDLHFPMGQKLDPIGKLPGVGAQSNNQAREAPLHRWDCTAMNQ